MGDTMNGQELPHTGYKSRTRKNVIQLFLWNAAWCVATALMALGPKFLWNNALLLTLLAVGLDVAVGVGMILANKKYLAELDELQRKVQLNAMGVTLGVSLIAGVPFSVMDAYHLLPFHADIASLLILMSLTFVASNLIRNVALPMKNRLKVLRAERDWRQAHLAGALHVSRQTINAIETGKFDPSLPLAFRTARLFGLRIEEIFQDEDHRSVTTEITKDALLYK